MSLYLNKYDSQHLLIRHRGEANMSGRAKKGLLKRLKPVNGVMKMDFVDVSAGKSGWIVKFDDASKLMPILNSYNRQYPMEPHKKTYKLKDIYSLREEIDDKNEEELDNGFQAQSVASINAEEVVEVVEDVENPSSIADETESVAESISSDKSVDNEEDAETGVSDENITNKDGEKAVHINEMAYQEKMQQIESKYINKLELLQQRHTLQLDECRDKETTLKNLLREKDSEIDKLLQNQEVIENRESDYIKELEKKEREKNDMLQKQREKYEQIIQKTREAKYSTDLDETFKGLYEERAQNLDNMMKEKEEEYKRDLIEKLTRGKEKVEAKLKEIEEQGLKKIEEKLASTEKKQSMTEDDLIRSKIKKFKKNLDFYKSYSLIPSQFDERNQKEQKSLPSSVDSYYSDDSLEFDTSPKSNNINELVSKLKNLEKKIINIELENKRNN